MREQQALAVLGVARLPPREPSGHGLKALRGALVGVGDDALLPGRERGPPSVVRLVTEARHGMMGHRPRELFVPASGQPAATGLAVAERAQRVIRGQQLVDIVKEGRGLDQ